MPASYLLDTNIVSYLLRSEFPILRSRFETTGAERHGQSLAITEAEVFFGIARKPGAARLRMAAAGLLRQQFPLLLGIGRSPSLSIRCVPNGSRKGRPLSTEDLMIAAHAYRLQGSITRYPRQRPSLHVAGLKTDDWTIG